MGVCMDKNVLQFFLDKHIINLNDVMGLKEEALMENIINKVHRYKITRGKGKDSRYVTSIPDPTKPRGTRQVRANSLSEMYKILLEFYGVKEEKELTLEQLFYEWIAYKKLFVGKKNKSLSSDTIDRYKKDFNKYIFIDDDFKNTPINKITPAKLIQFFTTMIEKDVNEDKGKFGMYESCFKNLYGYFNGMFELALDNDYISKNPCKKSIKELLVAQCTPNKTKVDEDRILTFDNVRELKKSILYHLSNHPYYMPDYAILLALLTGMRVGELAALRWTDVANGYINIDFAERRIVLDDGSKALIIGEPKNKKHRKFPISPEIQELLAEIKTLNINSDFIFARETGERYTAHDMACATQRRGNEAGIDNVTIHRIRRTVSSTLNTIMEQQTVANLLGHLESTNQRFYNYDITNYNDKIVALSAFVSKMEGREGNKKRTKNVV